MNIAHIAKDGACIPALFNHIVVCLLIIFKGLIVFGHSLVGNTVSIVSRAKQFFLFNLVVIGHGFIQIIDAGQIIIGGDFIVPKPNKCAGDAIDVFVIS